MKFFCIYDTLYEEYQMPFCMKSEKIAQIEFEIFVNNAVDKAPEKEKENTKNRFILCSFTGIRFDRDSGNILTDEKTFQPETLMREEE